MIAKPSELAARKQPPRALLLHGPDDGAVRDTAARLAAAWADAADPLSIVAIDAADLTADPGRLADEAAAVSMFGGARVIRIDGATDAAAEAVTLLLDGVAGDPVIITAGDLKKTSKLRQLAEKHPHALAVVHYADVGSSKRLAADRARALGLQPTRDALDRLEALAGGDRTVLAAELEKFALFLDASPEAPKRLDLEHLAALGADSGEAELDAFVAALLSGRGPALERQLALLGTGPGAIPTLRAIGRAIQQLIRIRAAIDAGQDPESAVKAARPPVFWKQQGEVADRAARWPTPRLHRALLAVLAAERAIKTPHGPGDVAGWQALLRLAPANRRAA